VEKVESSKAWWALGSFVSDFCSHDYQLFLSLSFPSFSIKKIPKQEQTEDNGLTENSAQEKPRCKTLKIFGLEETDEDERREEE